MSEFSWVGSNESFVDNPRVHILGSMIIGRYGGNSYAGQTKNEDGCLVWLNEKEDWEFVILLDAHNTAESADLIVKEFESRKHALQNILALPIDRSIKRIEEEIVTIFQDKDFLSACNQIKGETACMIVFRKDKYLWWFSVGDNILFLYHPELIKLGQHQVNQRHFYEWIGQVNTFDQPVPCYSSGVKELRNGLNRIFLTTDGLIECPGEPYKDPIEIYEVLESNRAKNAVEFLLENIQNHHVKDSTTIISWSVYMTKEVTYPSD